MKKLPQSLLMVLVACLALSCAKERPDQFSDGQGEGLQEISTIDAREITISTGEITAQNPASEAQILELDASSELNNLPLVALQSPPFYLKGVAVRGPPNDKITVVVKVTDKFLEVYRQVEKLSDLSLHELPMATQYNGKFISPVVFYPIDLIKVRRSKNSQGEETNQLIEEHVNSKVEAGNFKIDLRDKTEFSSAWEKDVYPKDILDVQQDWIFVPTVIKTSEGQKSLQGRQFSYDFNWQEVSRVKILQEKNRLRLVTLNLDPQLPVDAKNATTVLEIPVKWIDYKQEDFVQLDVSQAPSKDIDWSLKRFFKISFEQAQLPIFELNDNQDLTKVRIEKDYLSFDISYPLHGVDIRYSLFKAPPKHEGKIYYERDEKNFGFFKVEQNILGSMITPNKQIKQQHTYVSRFYPADNTIVYYLSDESVRSPEMLEIARKAIQSWNQVFHEIGSPIKVVLNEVRRVPLGDARYNTINIIDSVAQQDWLLGYGPSVIDTSSGEIISASTNLYVGPIKNILRYQIKDYIKLNRHKAEYTSIAEKIERLLDRNKVEGPSQNQVEVSNTLMAPKIQRTLLII